ncbi:hypothetical protein HanHA300_Chr12g0451001 [Helianthus annuus]|nr:hypothetical protein HanHA300_Chr12g0451001 [Helianthus annuus]KAJ0494132.1 hypothetical protein HanIR_Chr12g0593951 [Helianthus annuus]KAJ0863435.1 hypothetical protein HanPSC8_Chr12g0529981 [Helianthus annuus]
MLVQFSKLIESEIDKSCSDHGIDPSLETQVPGDKTVNQCPKGCFVFYTRILDQPNLQYPFTNSFLQVLKYYRLSLGQLNPVGVARIMHFEILCHALIYEPSLLMFRCFFHLAQNDDWYSIEKTQCEAPLLSTTMSTLDYILLSDSSGVEIEQRKIPEGSPSIVRHTEHLRNAEDLESVPLQPIIDGSSAKKLSAPVQRSTGGIASPSVAPQSSNTISMDSGDEDDLSVIASVIGVKFVKKEFPEASGGANDAYRLKIFVVLKKLNETKRSVLEKSAQTLELSDM